ncbi:MAG: squalene/phytoene synthase family protein [Pseudomonadota bacterium]|nr:squalene/phytoene synthase family protein [Pseudomonadota bacterium]
MPPGTPRYWGWLFAAPQARGPLLGVFALLAEWRALQDPGTDVSVARTKLAWWREEMDRLDAGAPLHPITRYLADFARAADTDFTPLARTVEATAAQVAGVPVERGTELESHAGALYGQPLLVAAVLSGASQPGSTLHGCIAALAVAQYLSVAIADYPREARAGRVPFAIDELLSAGIDNDDLVAAEPPPQLGTYLDLLRRRAADHYSKAAAALAPEERPRLRHLLVLATLGAKHLRDRKLRSGADIRLADLYNAWSAARRAATAR